MNGAYIVSNLFAVRLKMYLSIFKNNKQFLFYKIIYNKKYVLIRQLNILLFLQSNNDSKIKFIHYYYCYLLYKYANILKSACKFFCFDLFKKYCGLDSYRKWLIAYCKKSNLLPHFKKTKNKIKIGTQILFWLGCLFVTFTSSATHVRGIIKVK